MRITWAPWRLGHCWDSGAPGGPIWADRAAAVSHCPSCRTLNLKIFSFWIWWFHHFFRTFWLLLLTISSAAKEWRMKKVWRLEKALCTFNAAVRTTTQSRTFPSTSSQKWLYLKPSKRCQISARKVCFWWWEVTPLDDWGKYNFWFRLRSEIRQASFEQSSKPNMTTPLYW